METLLVLIALAALVAIVLGLIKPGLVLPFIAPEKRSRLKAFGLYTVIFLVCILTLPQVAPVEENLTESSEAYTEALPKKSSPLNPPKESSPMSSPVIIDMTYTLRPDFRVEVSASTNLPEGTEMLLSVGDNDIEAGFLGQDKAVVGDKNISFKPVGPLPNGNYVARLVVPIPRVQPKTVQAIIGSDGEYLKGELVEDGDFGKTIRQEVFFSVEGSSPSPAIEMKALKKDYADTYAALLQFKDNPDFWQYGFGRGGEYYDWLKHVQALDKKYSSQLCLKTGLLFGNLSVMGLEYRRSQGAETQVTQSFRKDIEKALQ